ncbi:MAG: tetratricopeptide repeat protein [Candidatus Kerfeldbacteria bacterium]|nr:tetratricopeptide repeat protein [Candidatus Kerfeldbacteria bacterium]
MGWLYYLIPSILAIAALAVLVVIYVRKFPKASALDLEAMPAHRQQRRKTSLVEDRLRRKFSGIVLSLRAFFKPIGKAITKILRSLFRGLVEKEKRYRMAAKGAVSTDAEPTVTATNVTTTVQEGATLLLEDKLSEAEKKFIAAIGTDSRCLDAYRGLAKVYEAQKNTSDAIATLQFMVQLDPKDEAIYRELGELQIKAQKYEDALESFEQALELGPNNPKNLDAFIEVAILNQLKYKAQSTLDKLQAVNPDNQKLAKYQEQIDAL